MFHELKNEQISDKSVKSDEESEQKLHFNMQWNSAVLFTNKAFTSLCD